MALLAPETAPAPLSPDYPVSLPTGTFTDGVLSDLNIHGGKQVLIDEPETRHLATQRALILYENESLRAGAYDTLRNRKRLQRAQEMVQVCVSSEVRFMDEQNQADATFIDQAIDIAMAHPKLKPTFDFVAPQTVDVLADNSLAAAYLERMWGSGRVMEDWLPIIDWGHLQHIGGTEGIDPASEHNTDIAAMKKWADRFSGHRIGQVVGVELQAIDEMLKYPTLFRLPGVHID